MATFWWHLEEIILSDQLFCDTPTQQKALASRGSPLDQSEGELTWWLVTLSHGLSLPCLCASGRVAFPKRLRAKGLQAAEPRIRAANAQRSPGDRGGSSGTLARHDALKLTTVLIRI